jgi:hypothetical protein
MFVSGHIAFTTGLRLLHVKYPLHGVEIKVCNAASVMPLDDLLCPFRQSLSKFSVRLELLEHIARGPYARRLA